MKKTLLFLLCLISFKHLNGQELSASQLLEKSINYHDPQAKWNQFKARFVVTSESPKRSLRKSIIDLDFLNSYFNLEVNQDGNTLTSTLDKGDCMLKFNGERNISEADQKKYRLDCDRAVFYKNYYTYLYGLPMKLKDPGTLLDPEVRKKKINGKEYWTLKVTYDENVGGDTWYFFFDLKTFALKQYQFYHDETKNDGEYILLEDQLIVEGIRMPKNRSWYYNANDQFLGIDRLSNN